jgi:cytoskeleton protein RodZ
MAEVGASLGAYLRGLRETKAASLGDMARTTRVSVCQLEALESDRLEELPAPVFVRGFIRAYCDYLGESPDEALHRHQTMSEDRSAGAEPRVAPAARRPPVWTAGPVVVSLVLLVVFGSGLLAINLAFRREPAPAAPAPAPTADLAPAAVPGAPAVTAGAPPRPAAVEATTAQHLLVKAVEPTWIRVQADGGRVVEELLAPGATREWTAEKRFVLTVGNAGGIELELNGQPMPPLGARGVVIRRLELPQASGS